jgi:hypothetical protein
MLRARKVHRNFKVNYRKNLCQTFSNIDEILFFQRTRESRECFGRTKAEKKKKERLDVDDSTQFLNAVQQNVALLDRLLVLPVLAVGSRSLDDSSDLVDLVVKPAGRYEPG